MIGATRDLSPVTAEDGLSITVTCAGAEDARVREHIQYRTVQHAAARTRTPGDEGVAARLPQGAAQAAESRTAMRCSINQTVDSAAR
ncbi:hypothetical protein CBOM_03184 [Ceraceosorus bombacis]|uniref:Uncharacterized protein n=1 Tax=Ceraceosorus bombacis TaxID=401625 RepID=A0A0P1BLX7_9BASI|nr:hypothetical protein CBOM_03184 [Ceraceosorus bombacis]